MFTALPSNINSLTKVLKSVDGEFILKFHNIIGSLELGTNTNQVMEFKIINSDLTLRNPMGVLYSKNINIFDKETSTLKSSKEIKIVTQEITFNPLNFSFIKSSVTSPVNPLTGKTIVLNGNTITLSDEDTLQKVSDTINSTNISNIFSIIIDNYLFIYSTKSIYTDVGYKNLNISGTAVSDLGLITGEIKNCNHEIISKGISYKVKEFINGINDYVRYLIIDKV